MQHICLIDPDVHPAAASFYLRYQVEPIAEANTVMQVPPEGIHEIPGMNLEAMMDRMLVAMNGDRGGRVMTIHHGDASGILVPVASGTRTSASADALNVLRSEFRTPAEAGQILRLPPERIVVIRRKMEAVQRLGLDAIVMRSCNVGQWAHIVEAIRRFFGARFAEAPTFRDSFSSGVIVATDHPGTRPWQAFAGHPRAQSFQTPRGDLLFRSISTGSTHFRPEIMAESQAAIEAWLDRQIPAGAWVRPSRAWASGYNILLHGMFTERGLIFPGEDYYRRNLFRTS